MKHIFILFMLLAAGKSGWGVKNVSQYRLDEKSEVKIDEHLQGIWKMAEDTSSHNYFIVEKDGDYGLSLTYMNKHGDNRGLEHWGASFSKVKNTTFLQVPNWDWNHHGYMFLKINSISTPRSWDVVAQLVVDPTLYKMTSSEEIRAYFERNLDNPNFYGSELHFRKKFEFNSFRPSE